MALMPPASGNQAGTPSDRQSRQANFPMRRQGRDWASKGHGRFCSRPRIHPLWVVGRPLRLPQSGVARGKRGACLTGSQGRDWASKGHGRFCSRPCIQPPWDVGDRLGCLSQGQQLIKTEPPRLPFLSQLTRRAQRCVSSGLLSCVFQSYVSRAAATILAMFRASSIPR